MNLYLYHMFFGFTPHDIYNTIQKFGVRNKYIYSNTFILRTH